MTTPENRSLPSPQEVAAADALAREFLRQISAVPADERILITSEKFAGPIGIPRTTSEHRTPE